MSPNPTVENAVTAKYSPSVCVSRAPKLLVDIVDMTTYVLANSNRNSGRLVVRASGPSDGAQAREQRSQDRAGLERDQPGEHHKGDHQDRDGGAERPVRSCRTITMDPRAVLP
jgi:hypothetical protein